MHPIPVRIRTVAVIVMILGLATTACGTEAGGTSSTTPSSPTTPQTPVVALTTATTAPPPAIGTAEVILVAEVVGGCAMMGPNCPTYVLWDDGRAIVVRGSLPVDPFATRIDDAAVERVGFVDASLAAEIAELVADTDLNALVAQLGPGRCNACVDGVDTVLSLATANGIRTLSSVDVEFDTSMPFFAATARVVEALGVALPLETQTR